MLLKYFANHYANPGNWTHVCWLFKNPESKITNRLERSKATDMVKDIKSLISKEQMDKLKTAMKYRRRFIY